MKIELTQKLPDSIYARDAVIGNIYTNCYGNRILIIEQCSDVKQTYSSNKVYGVNFGNEGGVEFALGCLMNGNELLTLVCEAKISAA